MQDTTLPPRDDADVLALERTLRSAHRFRGSAFGALLTLAILLGKAVVCQHAPGRSVFFDAMLMIPISMLAYQEGVVTGLVAAMLTTAVDVVFGAQAAAVTIPTYLSDPLTRSSVVARLFSFEVLALIVATLSYRARRQTHQARKQTEAYLSRIRDLQRHNEAIAQDARDRQAVFEKRILRYSSLLHLLEESARKINANLEIKRLFQSLFRVLEECFGSQCASVFLLDERTGAYYLASAYGADEHGEHIPMMLQSDNPLVQHLEATTKSVFWRGSDKTATIAKSWPMPVAMSGVLIDKGSVTGIVNVHLTDRSTQPDSQLMGMVCNIASIALVNSRLFGEVRWMADRDPLTKLHNRRAFHRDLDEQLATCRETGRPVSLLMLDIDHFKSFNDTYGHQAGDAVLSWFANHCVDVAGPASHVYRYGGEEFNVLMPATDVAAAQKLAEELRRSAGASTFRYDGVDLRLTISVGVATAPNHATGSDELVRKADRSLYRAKGAGRNAVAVSDAKPGAGATVVPYEVRVAATSRTDGTPGRE
jgi:diguanylate cyclase (GGDEF)-like protein